MPYNTKKEVSMLEQNSKTLYKVMISPIKWNRKPTNEEIKDLVQPSFVKTELSPDELVKALLVGKTIRPGYGGSKIADWKSQDYFFVDVDHNLTIEDIMKKCEKYGLKPMFVYYSFSYEEGEPGRFRLVFRAERTIVEIEERNNIQKTLMYLTAGEDAVWKTVSPEKIFFGTNKGSYYEDLEATFDTEYVLSYYEEYYKWDQNVQAQKLLEKALEELEKNKDKHVDKSNILRFKPKKYIEDAEYTCLQSWVETARFNLDCMENLYNEKMGEWKDGSGRKDFIFWCVNLNCF